MKNLVDSIFSKNPKTSQLFELLKDSESKKNINVQGLVGSAKAFFIASLFLKEKKLSCIVLPDRETASYFYDDLTSIIGEEYVLIFPSAYKRSVEYLKTDKTNIVLKTEVLNKLISGKKPYLVVTYPGALIEKVIKTKSTSNF